MSINFSVKPGLRVFCYGFGMQMKVQVALIATALSIGTGTLTGQTVDLPTSKQLVGEIPGHPQRINSLPMSMAVSPDGRYVVTVDAGYGTRESKFEQSLSVLDTRVGTLQDFPDDRTAVYSKQTLYSGLAFSHDGSHIYASMGSIEDPLGDAPDGKDAGSGIVVYRFSDGKISPEREIHLPLEPLAPGRKTKLLGEAEGDKGVPFPAAIAVVGSAGSEKLLVADNLSDDVLLIDPNSTDSTAKVEKRFDLSESNAVPGTYPIALALSKDGARAFVALWNASEVVELNLAKGTIGRKLPLLKPSSATAPGTHPCALEISPDGSTMYVALANHDAVAAVNIASGQFAAKGYFDTRLPGQSFFGAEPEALALNTDGSRLYVANAISDAVAVIDTTKLTVKAGKQGMIVPMGFLPTEWMPMSMTFLRSPAGNRLYVATAKGHGTGPNGAPMQIDDPRTGKPRKRNSTYIGTLLYGSWRSSMPIRSKRSCRIGLPLCSTRIA